MILTMKRRKRKYICNDGLPEPSVRNSETRRVERLEKEEKVEGRESSLRALFGESKCRFGRTCKELGTFGPRF